MAHPQETRRPKPPPFLVTPEPGDELDDLLARLDMADAQLDEAKKYRDSIDAKVKAHLTGMVPRNPDGSLVTGTITVPASQVRKPRTLSWKVTRVFSKDKFDADHPGMREQYMVPGKGFWSW